MKQGKNRKKTSQNYILIEGCPRCHGMLFYYNDPAMSRYSRTIKCYNCGAIFVEVESDHKRVLLRPLTPNMTKNGHGVSLLQPLRTKK